MGITLLSSGLRLYSANPNLESVKAWTVSEARQLAVWKHRETYLHEAGVYRNNKLNSKQ